MEFTIPFLLFNMRVNSNSLFVICMQCYCYVCDTAAPCLSWSLSSANACLSHCNASENTANWKQERLLRKQLSTMFKK